LLEPNETSSLSLSYTYTITTPEQAVYHNKNESRIDLSGRNLTNKDLEFIGDSLIRDNTVINIFIYFYFLKIEDQKINLVIKTVPSNQVCFSQTKNFFSF